MDNPRVASMFAKLARDLPPVISEEVPAKGEDKATTALNASNLMPSERDMKQATTRRWWWSRSPKLDTTRESSTIPISPRTELPKHQAQASTWQYPSEEMFYNAMTRKGWQPSAEDMQQVVKIHNAVNERCWAHVMAWERRHCDSCPDPKLLKFRGRPQDFSPKARLLNFLGYKLPFDRHDWVVDRCGTEVRYVIDFYNAVPFGGSAPVAMHLDVRPALDGPQVLLDRLSVQMAWGLSGEWAK